jgi:hypothetical protein
LRKPPRGEFTQQAKVVAVMEYQHGEPVNASCETPKGAHVCTAPARDGRPAMPRGDGSAMLGH